jgi:hypothetical protein
VVRHDDYRAAAAPFPVTALLRNQTKTKMAQNVFDFSSAQPLDALTH